MKMVLLQSCGFFRTRVQGFNFETAYPTEIKIHNSLGQEVYRKEFEAGHHQIDLSTESNGLYLLE
jgi:hypothetical protein